MAKTYIDTVKYVVFSDVEIVGLVEKPDVVGAIFGQTEGLLGDELDLRDLQKNGRIGRIEVDLNAKNGKTVGTIKIPSSLDMVETCIIAAALETVDRVGPCEAKIKIEKVEDTRNEKRQLLVDRAKEILKNLINTELPESREISEIVRDEVKTAEISQYGPDKLPAGPNLHKYKDVVIVEGRADVINMLKNDVPNVVAIEGARVPNSVIGLSKEKETTVFLDGDRGGDIILKELIDRGVEIDFIARAPVGKEVEELTRKELIKCLRNKIPYEQNPSAEKRATENKDFKENRDFRENREVRPNPRESAPREMNNREIKPEYREVKRPINRLAPIRSEKNEDRKAVMPVVVKETVQETKEPPTEKKKFNNSKELVNELNELNNTLRARFYNEELETIKEVPVRDVIKSLDEINNVGAIVFDGIITQRLVDLATIKGVKTIIGIKIGNVNKKPQQLEIITKA